MTADTTYLQQNARFRIDGYYSPSVIESQSLEGRIAAFERAKAECIKNMQRDIDFTRSMTPEMFWPKLKYRKEDVA